MDEYTDETVAKVAEQYTLLRESLRELRDVKKSNGAIVTWVSNHYSNATNAVEFLRTSPIELQERLKMRDLERELLEFGNTHINL